ncbi:MAG: 50S ribosomal protein L24 [Candidatus Parcubacteria bacterium]|nr:MAG: 50S ribosomal protein L24 [Candidatus Parcubacteria bacterium]
MKIKSGDTVLIIRGKDRGKSGKVIKVFKRTSKIVVGGLNLVKKHIRPKRQGEKGKIIEMSAPLSVSKVKLICPNCHQPTRVGYKFENNKKFRFCKKCQNLIS